MARIIIWTLALFSCLYSTAQNAVKDSSLFDPHVSVTYAYQIPGGDLASRFGNNHNLGLGFHIKTKTSWFYGIQGTYLFGSRVIPENGFLENLKIEGGYILDNDGQLSKISLQERGWTCTLDGGKLFPVFGPNPNSGILVMGGAGLFQHKIRIEHQETHIQQLEKEYLKGYDRLTNGPVFREFVGYFYMSNNRLVNFVIGLEAWQAFTQSRRDLNFDTMTADTQKRNDSLFGIRAGWTLHLYKRMSDNYYYY